MTDEQAERMMQAVEKADPVRGWQLRTSVFVFNMVEVAIDLAKATIDDKYRAPENAVGMGGPLERKYRGMINQLPNEIAKGPKIAIEQHMKMAEELRKGVIK